eukprot:233182-Pyramimonas_sp.AAC.1
MRRKRRKKRGHARRRRRRRTRMTSGSGGEDSSLPQGKMSRSRVRTALTRGFTVSTGLGASDRAHDAATARSNRRASTHVGHARHAGK